MATARVKLLNKKGELIPEAKAIFKSWFKRFCNDEGVMTPLECATFIKATTNTVENYIPPHDNRIVMFFKEYSLETFGKLTEDEFLKFYTDKAH